jgi:hypothetical protein
MAMDFRLLFVLLAIANVGHAEEVPIVSGRVLGVGHVSTLSRVVRRNPLPVLFNGSAGQATTAPQAEIANNVIKMRLYLPDPERGFYRGTRFDWSGVIGSLVYRGHNYYGPWFTIRSHSSRFYL